MKKALPLLLILALLLCGCGGGTSSPSSGSISVYRLVSGEYRDELGLTYAETASVPSDSDAVAAAVAAFRSAPEDDRLLSPIPQGVEILSATAENGVVNVLVSRGEEEPERIAESELCACLALTLCQLPGIDGVTVACGDDLLCVDLSPDDIVLNNTVVSPDKVGCRLYFPTADGSGMDFEYRTIDLSQSDSAQRSIVDELIKGPVSSRLRSDIPAETVLLSISTENGLCTVSLSAAFLGGEDTTKETAENAVYSIVDSLTSLRNIMSVQLLIDGRVTGSVCGVDISVPLTSNIHGEDYISEEQFE